MKRVIRVIYQDTITCRDGHPDADVRIIATAVNDADPVKVVLCFACDRLRCYSCKRPLNGYLARCGCGGQTFRTVPLIRY